jgi:hypothetical protein
MNDTTIIVFYSYKQDTRVICKYNIYDVYNLSDPFPISSENSTFIDNRDTNLHSRIVNYEGPNSIVVTSQSKNSYPTLNNLNTQQKTFHGIVQESGLIGNYGPVSTMYDRSICHTNLTPGAIQYVTTNGDITENFTKTVLGIALDTNTLLLDNRAALGITGASGPRGFRGDSGDNGSTGPIGPTGPIGLQGFTGPVGPLGVIADYASYYFQNNTTPTIVSAKETYYKIEGYTTIWAIEGFTHSNNKLTYTGNETAKFIIHASCSLEGTSNHEIMAIKIFKNSNDIGIRSHTTVYDNSPVIATLETIVELKYNDYIELWVTNLTNSGSMNCRDLNFTICKICNIGITLGPSEQKENSQEVYNLYHKEPAGTSGGDSYANTWTKRKLNMLETNGNTNVTLINDELILEPGTWSLLSYHPCYDCKEHQARLYDVTNNKIEKLGSNVTTDSNKQQSTSTIIHVWTITNTTTYKFEHITNQTIVNGFGKNSSFPNEQIYSQVQLTKI